MVGFKNQLEDWAPGLVNTMGSVLEAGGPGMILLQEWPCQEATSALGDTRHFQLLICPDLVILEMGVSQTICPGWLQTSILLISASFS
jgi:hypothetical protein